MRPRLLSGLRAVVVALVAAAAFSSLGDGGPARGAPYGPQGAIESLVGIGVSVPGADVPMSTPTGVTWDGVDSIIIADYTNCVIYKQNIFSNLVTHLAGTGRCGSDQESPLDSAALHRINGPVGVTVYGGEIYFADQNNCRIRKIDSGGHLVTVVGDGVCGYTAGTTTALGARLSFPSALAFDSAGLMYIADTFNCVIRVYDPGLNQVYTGSGAAGSCTFAGEGIIAGSPSVRYNLPTSIMYDGSRLWIADYGNCRVRRIQSAVITTFAGNGSCTVAGDGGPATSASINLPVWATPVGADLYIADYAGCRIRKVSGGIISTIANNTGTCGYSGDYGPALTAVMTQPYAIASDGTDLFFADEFSCRVRKISAAQVITTITGPNGCSGIAALAAPSGDAESLAVAPNGDVYYSDNYFLISTFYNQCMIWKLADGVRNPYAGAGGCAAAPGAGDGGPALNVPMFDTTGLDLDPAGNLYIAIDGHCRVRRVNTAGTISSYAGAGQPGCAVYSPSTDRLGTDIYDAKLDPTTGHLYVLVGTGSCTASIARYTAANTGAHWFGPVADACSPGKLAIDSSGQVFYSSRSSCRVYRAVAPSTSVLVAGTGACGFNGDSTPTATAFNSPAGLRFDEFDNLLIADQLNCLVRQMDAAQTAITTIAGVAGNCASSPEGTVIEGDPIDLPYDVGVDNAGNLYVTESNRVRIVYGYLNDADSDGIGYAADNCPSDANAGQENNDRNFIDNPSPLTQDDTSRVMSDDAGDVCDPEDDNDGLPDTAEATFPGMPGCGSATAALNPFNPDSDADGYLDSAECALSTNPASAASRPTQAACAAHLGVAQPTDTDGDLLADRTEFCGYGSSRTIVDSDADTRRDGCEAASLNTLPAVNSGDQLLFSQAITADLLGPFVYNGDLNKDGANNSGDQLLMAQILTGGSC